MNPSHTLSDEGSVDIIQGLVTRNGGRFVRVLALACLFAIVLLFELAMVALFGFLFLQGVAGWRPQPWFGTLTALIPVVGLLFVVPKQLPVFLAELIGRYTVEIERKTITLHSECAWITKTRRIARSEGAYAAVAPFFPGFGMVMIQSEQRLNFGLSLPRSEQTRMAEAINLVLAI